jgi:acyl-CoA thioester hydrolase
MSESFDTIVRVRYAETDKMGVVYYANYYVYFEIGRVEYMRNLGIDYREMEIQDDTFIVVAESKCRYLKPARYDDRLRIRTRATSVRKRTIRFEYEILHDETAELLAAGETVHIVCDSNGRAKSLPEKYRRILNVPSAEESSSSLAD